MDDDEREAAPSSIDPVRTYLRAIASVPLLTREQEVALAKRIEEGSQRILSAVLRDTGAVSELAALGRRLRRGEVRVRDVVLLDEEVVDAHEAERVSRQLARVERHRRTAEGRTRLARMLIKLRLQASVMLALVANIKARGAHLDAARGARVEAGGGVSAAEQQRTYDDVREGERITAEARRAIIDANLRLVVSIAKKFENRGLQFLDLVQEGNLGLMKGVERFDYRRGFKLSTYATWWIRQSITRAIADKARTIRVPAHTNSTLASLTRATRSLRHALRREPTADDLAEKLGISEEKVRALWALLPEPLSLGTPVGSDGEATLADFVEDKRGVSALDIAVSTSVAEQTGRLLTGLTPREEKIIRMRFGFGQAEGCTLEEIGQVFGVTRERIRQIEAKALAKLRRRQGHAEIRLLLED